MESPLSPLTPVTKPPRETMCRPARHTEGGPPVALGAAEGPFAHPPPGRLAWWCWTHSEEPGQDNQLGPGVSSTGAQAAWGGHPQGSRLQLTPDLPVFGEGAGRRLDCRLRVKGRSPRLGANPPMPHRSPVPGLGLVPQGHPGAPWGCPHPPHPPPWGEGSEAKQHSRTRKYVSAGRRPRLPATGCGTEIGTNGYKTVSKQPPRSRYLPGKHKQPSRRQPLQAPTHGTSAP